MMQDSALAPKLAAPQQRPRPLPLFLDMLRSETAEEPERMARALEGLRAYQEAVREPPPELMPAIAQLYGASLRDYGGDGRLVLFVPSLINPPNVLDLGAGKSLLRWLADRGHRVLLLDWGWDLEGRRDLSVAGHVEEVLLPLLRELEKAPALVGYCLGGTMAIAAAMLEDVRSVATIAAPWHFSGFGDAPRSLLLQLWERNRGGAETMGLLPMEVLQTAFWSLDPKRTVGKFERFAELDSASAEAQNFVTLEDWANDGPPLGLAAAGELFESFFEDDATGRGEWKVGGRQIDLAELSVPALTIVSMSDRIVPAASAPPVGERLQLRQGHVGMIVGGSAKQALWEPLHLWLSR